MLLLATSTACQVDTAHPIAPPGSSTPVNKLSELGIFVGNLADQVPRADFYPYDVNVSLYADGASKLRFVYVPPGTSLGATSDRFSVPVGAYIVKTFYFPRDARDSTRGRQLIETRFLVKRADGYLVSTYLWNADQTDAVASGGNVNVPVSWIDEDGVEHDDHFHVPGTSQCQSCHADRALGLRTRQLAGSTAATQGELERLVSEGVLDRLPEITESLVDPFGDGSIDQRARSYLDADCSHCHGEGGSAAGTHVFWDLEHTGPQELPLCRSTPSVGGADRVIVPGDPQNSAFLTRMRSNDPFLRMPRGPTHVPDGKGIAVLSDWVLSMTPGGCE